MKIIKSSEVASYIFCPVCWWTERINGVKITKAISKGENYHNFISENQLKARFLYAGMMVLIIVIINLVIFRFLG